MKSYFHGQVPRHVAIIMDGNGRWAVARGLSRCEGHIAGAAALRRTVEVAPRLGIDTLTMFAFSSANWQRPAPEVAALLQLFHEHLVSECDNCLRQGVRMSIVGRRDRLPPSLRTAVAAVETATRGGTVLHLRLAIDYSSREAIMAAAQRIAARATFTAADLVTIDDFSHLVARHTPDDDCPAEIVPDVDLLIRTGGERRLSDFLLWESAFAELYFTDRMWPDFNADDLTAAIDDFASRERRFGRVAPSPEASSSSLRYAS